MKAIEREAKILKMFIADERRMRFFVFRASPHKQHQKIGECDRALQALKTIVDACPDLQRDLFAPETPDLP